jgi:hypothetical protein
VSRDRTFSLTRLDKIRWVGCSIMEGFESNVLTESCGLTVCHPGVTGAKRSRVTFEDAVGHLNHFLAACAAHPNISLMQNSQLRAA